jgi:hypothetical protein
MNREPTARLVGGLALDEARAAWHTSLVGPATTIISERHANSTEGHHSSHEQGNQVPLPKHLSLL